MSRTISTAQRSKQQYIAKVKKLQNAGLIGKVDLRKNADKATLRTIEKYKGLLNHKEGIVRADSVKQATELRKKFGFTGKGKTVVIPREKGERFSITKKGEIKSVRPNPVEPTTRIRKTFGEKLKTPPAKGDKLYYTLPERKRGLGRVKRKTFSSFDEMLFYLNSYDIDFDDVEDYIEIEEVVGGGSRDTALKEKIAAERHQRYLAKKRKSRKKPKRKASRKRR